MIKLLNIFRKEKSPKISKMLLDVAGEYIAMGDDQEDKQQLLNGAVNAWNIACLQLKERKTALKKFHKNYCQMNPSHTKSDYADAMENIQLLISRAHQTHP